MLCILLIIEIHVLWTWSEKNGSAVKNLQRSDGVLECWSSGLKLENNLRKKISDGIPKVLSFVFSITPELQNSRTPGKEWNADRPPYGGEASLSPLGVNSLLLGNLTDGKYI